MMNALRKKKDVLLLLFILVAVSSCRPRYLRCSNKRYCETETTFEKKSPITTQNVLIQDPNSCK